MTDIDINKAIAAQINGGDLSHLARADELRGWSREGAQNTARAEGIELQGDHWKVIEMLQSLYLKQGPAPHARMVADLLNEAFSKAGGSRYLYQLFPGGPVSQGSRLAGVPAPHDAKDPSFGTRY